ncbi:MAG: amidohydrolase family protein [Planctomycetes bacterium]|nr:amidohydrolase family protein [Planctomycetota bacterium]
MLKRSILAAFALLTTQAAFAQAPDPATAPKPGERGAPGLAIRTAKALTCKWEGESFVDHALVLVKDGKIQAVGPVGEVAVPQGYELLDVGDMWLMPGMIDLHAHIGGSFDINDMVYVTQPELKVHASVVPHNSMFKRALASGVTSVLYIPGSGVNSGGQGILVKTGIDEYDEAVIRDPGSLKVAQWGNPERWGPGVGKTWENYHLRDMFRRGKAYADAWDQYEKGEGPQPEKRIEMELFRELYGKRTQVSTHTQVYQVVLETLTMIRQEFGIDVYIDHGEVKGYLTAPLAEKLGVSGILGPRNVDMPRLFGMDTDGQWQGIAAEYQKRGLKKIGFNTDSPVIPEEELQLQVGIAGRFGFEMSNMEGVKGLTIVPAMTAGIADRVGSLEPKKDADIVVISGDPGDPRAHVSLVIINGKRVYDVKVDDRRW